MHTSLYIYLSIRINLLLNHKDQNVHIGSLSKNLKEL